MTHDTPVDVKNQAPDPKKLNESKLLIDSDENLMYNKRLACLIGDRQATALQQIHYWLSLNSKINRADHFFDGQWWAYNTWKSWRETDFPMWGITTIRRVFWDLEFDGLIVTRPHQNQKHGQWVTINYGAVELKAKEDKHHSIKVRRLKHPIYPVQIGQGKSLSNPSSLSKSAAYPVQIGQPTGDPETTTETTKDSSTNVDGEAQKPKRKSVAPSLRAVAQSGERAVEDQASTPPSADEVDPKPKRKLTPHQELTGALIRAFGKEVDTMTDAEKKRYGKVAGELGRAKCRAEDVPALYAFVQKLASDGNWKPWGVNALSGHYSEWVESKPKNVTATQNANQQGVAASFESADERLRRRKREALAEEQRAMQQAIEEIERSKRQRA